MPGKAAATVVSSEAEAKPDSPSLLSALGPKEASADSADRGKNTSVGTFYDPWPGSDTVICGYSDTFLTILNCYIT